MFQLKVSTKQGIALKVSGHGGHPKHCVKSRVYYLYLAFWQVYMMTELGVYLDGSFVNVLEDDGRGVELGLLGFRWQHGRPHRVVVQGVSVHLAVL